MKKNIFAIICLFGLVLGLGACAAKKDACPSLGGYQNYPNSQGRY